MRFDLKAIPSVFFFKNRNHFALPCATEYSTFMIDSYFSLYVTIISNIKVGTVIIGIYLFFYLAAAVSSSVKIMYQTPCEHYIYSLMYNFGYKNDSIEIGTY